MCNTHSMRKPLARLRQEATSGIAVATALIAIPLHASFHDEVPARVGHLPFTLGPLERDRVSVSEFAARTSPKNSEHHAKREECRNLTRPSKSLSHDVLGMHQRSFFGQLISTSIAQPHCGWQPVSQSLCITAIPGNPFHVDVVAANVMGQSPELPPQLTKVFRGCGVSVVGLVPGLLELRVARDDGDVL